MRTETEIREEIEALRSLTTAQLKEKYREVLSRLSWKWRERSTAKITERTREETTKALHR